MLSGLPPLKVIDPLGVKRVGGEGQIETAWGLALSRPPRPAERRLAKAFFQSGGSLPDFCLALFNRNEFIYVP